MSIKSVHVSAFPLSAEEGQEIRLLKSLPAIPAGERGLRGKQHRVLSKIKTRLHFWFDTRVL